MRNQPIEHRIMRKGKQYIPALLPADIPRGKMGHCFDNCAVIAIEGKYKYVEGIAGSFKDGVQIMHAWLTDGVHAFDRTWKAYDLDGKEIPFPGFYIGIEMDVHSVAEFMLKTKHAGVFPNAYMAPELAEKLLV